MTRPVVVVGAGLAGAAAAWRLAQRGREVVLVEAVGPAHMGGSSHGSARIFRHAYPDPFYVGLSVRALAGWRELEAASGQTLLSRTGGLDWGRGRNLDAIAAALAVHGLPAERMGSAAAAERWPHLRIDGPVLHQPDAGVIDAAASVTAMVAEARRLSAEVLIGDPVTAVAADGAGAVVRLDGGRAIRAAAVVVAAGAWLPELLAGLPDEIAALIPPLTVTQQQAFHFPFPEERGADWPIWVEKDALSVYSLPGGQDAGGAGFKIAEHDRGRVTTATTRDGSIDPASRERIVDHVRRTLPGVDPVPYAETSCLYTSTAHEDFLIDRVGPVVIASPCSGHGAKFAPLVGELIADAVTGDAPVPSRFALQHDVAAASAVMA